MWVSPIEYVKILQSQIVNPGFHTLFIFFLIGWHIKTFYQRWPGRHACYSLPSFFLFLKEKVVHPQKPQVFPIIFPFISPYGYQKLLKNNQLVRLITSIY